MSIGATYKDPRSGLFLKHIAGEIVFRRIGKGVVEVLVNHTYKLEGELAFSYKQPVHKWVKTSEANAVLEKIFKDAESALEPLYDLRDSLSQNEGSEIPPKTSDTHPLGVPYNPEVHPVEASGPLKSSPDSKTELNPSDSSPVDGAKPPSAEGTQ